MSERPTQVNSDARIKVEAKRIAGFFVLEGRIDGVDTFLAVTSETSDFTQFNAVNCHYPVQRCQYYDRSVLVAHSENFELYTIPRPSQSAGLGSETQYAGQTKNKEIAIQLLRGYQRSKPAHHHDGREFYYHIIGQLAVRMLDPLNGEINEEILSGENPEIVVPAGFAHQVKSVGGVAMSVLVCNFTKHEYHPETDLFHSN